MAVSYLNKTAISSGAAAELAAERKTAKYSSNLPDYCFLPLAFETLGPLNLDNRLFLSKLGKLLSRSTNDPRETGFLFQRLSVEIQRFNAISLHNTFLRS